MDCFHEILELGYLVGGDLGSLDVAIRVDTAFKAMTRMCQRGHILALSFQMGRLETSLFPNVPTHVLPSFNLKLGQGELFLMYLFCFFLPFLPPSFCVPPAAPAAAAGAFAASCSIRSVVVGGSVKDNGRFRANVPKQMLSSRRRQSRMLSSILSHWVAVMQSSSQSWKQVSTVYINLQQNSMSVRTWALTA